MFLLGKHVNLNIEVSRDCTFCSSAYMMKNEHTIKYKIMNIGCISGRDVINYIIY